MNTNARLDAMNRMTDARCDMRAMNDMNDMNDANDLRDMSNKYKMVLLKCWGTWMWLWQCSAPRGYI